MVNGTKVPNRHQRRAQEANIAKQWAELKAKMVPLFSRAPVAPFPGNDFMEGLTLNEVAVLREAVLEVHIKQAPTQPISIQNIDEIIAGIGPKVAEDMIRKIVDEKVGSDEFIAKAKAPMKVKEIK